MVGFTARTITSTVAATAHQGALVAMPISIVWCRYKNCAYLCEGTVVIAGRRLSEALP